MRLHSRLATLALSVGLTGTAFAQTLEPTNVGPMRENVFTGHVLTPAPAEGEKGVALRILYCPSESDDAGYRAAIGAAAGGAIVDYFDARAGTPSGALLDTYDAIHTWANFAYFDNVAMGDALALANDGGAEVVLGVFCTYTSGNFLSGAIMTPAYCPVVSPTGFNHFTTSPYVGDGTTCLYTGVASLDSTFRDILTTQGAGVVDGTAADGEICHAYRPGGAGSVVYSNGSGASALGGTGDWAVAVANAATCLPAPPVASCTQVLGALGVNPTGYTCATVPVAGSVWTANVDTTPSVGVLTQATVLALGNGGATSGGLTPSGFEPLVAGPLSLHFANGTHSFVIPPSFVGMTLHTQAARQERDATGATVFVLLNGQDLVIG